MARVTTPLTDKEVSQTKPKDKEYSLVDGGGLMLRAKPNSSKLWLFNYYRPYIKKWANIGFGQYPDVSLLKANHAANEQLVSKCLASLTVATTTVAIISLIPRILH